ncbi:hypothetical protein [Desulfocurvibacter africanus]|nr:hypothetical protein [Desulfocurvibacter africanus]
MNQNIPLKLRIAGHFSDGLLHGVDDIFTALSPEYGRERQFTRETIDNHLKSLCVVGIIKDAEAMLDGDDRLIVTYRISDFGRMKIRKAF